MQDPADIIALNATLGEREQALSTAPLLPVEELRFDPNARCGEIAPILRAAATGVLGAQRELRDGYLVAISMGFLDHPAIIAIEAIAYARLAASQGDSDDVLCLVSALRTAASLMRRPNLDPRLCDAWDNEALILLGGLAETGNLRAVALAQSMVADQPLEIISAVQAESRGNH